MMKILSPNWKAGLGREGWVNAVKCCGYDDKRTGTKCLRFHGRLRYRGYVYYFLWTGNLCDPCWFTEELSKNYGKDWGSSFFDFCHPQPCIYPIVVYLICLQSECSVRGQGEVRCRALPADEMGDRQEYADITAVHIKQIEERMRVFIRFNSCWSMSNN